MPESSAPAISVIVPVYNVERYLRDCLDSVLAQSFDDFEIVIVDDGSTDGSSAIVASYSERYPERIRSFTKANGGLSDARNFGMDRARGAYFAFVDADDEIVPPMLATMHARANDTGAELVLCGILHFSDRDLEGVYYPEPDMSVFGTSLAQEPRLLYRVDAAAWDKLYARELFVRSGLRFPVGLRFEDVPTTYRLLAYANRVEKVDEPLYRYRRDREESISGRYDERYLDLLRGFEMIDDAYAQSGIFTRNCGALLRLHLTHLVAGRYPDLFLRADAGFRRRFIAEVFALLDARFPGWRQASECRELWRNPVLRLVSTDAWLLRALCLLPSRAYLSVLARLGSFDPNR